jgi:hypothetical protein
VYQHEQRGVAGSGLVGRGLVHCAVGWLSGDGDLISGKKGARFPRSSVTATLAAVGDTGAVMMPVRAPKRASRWNPYGRIGVPPRYRAGSRAAQT